jgi:hypothetical protein
MLLPIFFSYLGIAAAAVECTIGNGANPALSRSCPAFGCEGRGSLEAGEKVQIECMWNNGAPKGNPPVPPVK